MLRNLFVGWLFFNHMFVLKASLSFLSSLAFTFFSNPVFGHQDNPVHLKRCPRVVVISYTMLHRLRKSMLEREWALLIVDESHHVRCTQKASEPEEVCSFSISFSTV